MLKTLIKTIFIDTFVYDQVQSIRRIGHYNKWNKDSCPVPPPHVVKQKTIIEAATRKKRKIFVETGTYDGDMTYAVRNIFSEIYTVELFEPLFQKAKKRFSSYSHINVLLGDSAEKMPEILASINEPALFWLDGHFSGVLEGKQTGSAIKQTPIIEELKAIAQHKIKEHSILIDDARCFNGTADYPTIKELSLIVEKLFPNHTFHVEADIIRVL